MISNEQKLWKALSDLLQGDFNLAALDLLPDAELYWVGNCNELNAGVLSR
jgi:pyruvate decarboxylase